MTTPLTNLGFLAMLGVNTHIGYTDGSYSDIGKVISDLQFLGISQVRDGITNGENGSAPISSYIALAKAGIRFDIIVSGSSRSALNDKLELVKQVLSAVPHSIVGIEGPNEINNLPVTFDGVSGLEGALNEQKALYSAVRADSALRGVPVNYFTGYNAGGIPMGPDPFLTPGLADSNTQHPYPGAGQPPAGWVTRPQALPNQTYLRGPAVYTETGYATSQSNAAVQAKYELDLVMDTASENISKTFLYELMDAYAPASPQGNDGWGLFDHLGAPKPAATALHNLTTLLDDRGASAEGSGAIAVRHTITGLPSSGDCLTLQRSDGIDTLIVWAEPKIWDSTKKAEIAASPSQVTVHFENKLASIQVFDPLIGLKPISHSRNVDTVKLQLVDHPLIIQTNRSPVYSIPKRTRQP